MSSAHGESCAMENTDEQGQAAIKKKRSLPGTPDPDAEVMALSPRTLMATNRFSCEVCGKGFQRDQNLQLHRRGHNLPWKLKQREGQEARKKVYVCPEVTCVHHHPSRALGDLTGIKKHYSRKHGEKKWKCEKCSKKYAVFSDWKAHQKVCGTREYRCDCGTLFSRRDSFITHRAFCDALAEENARSTAHKQVESQQSGGPEEENTLSVPNQDLSSAIDPVSSPLSQPMNILPDSDVCEPSVQEDLLPTNCTLDENRTLSASPNWIQDNVEVKSFKPSKGPALSLHLGTGPGPGPPQVLNCLPETPAFMEMNRAGTPLSEGDSKNKWSSSAESTGILLGTRPQVYDALDSLHGSIQVPPTGSTSTGVMNSATPQFAFPTGSMFAQNVFRYPLRPLIQQRHYTASGQMPATALLQKAAMMGATASNPFLLRNLGLRGDASSLLSGGTGQDSWAQPTLPSSMHAFPSGPSIRGLQHLDHSHQYGAYGIGTFHPTVYSGQGNVQDFMLVNTPFGGTAAVLKDSSTDVSSSPINQMVFAGHDSRQNHARMGSLKLLDNTTLAGLEAPQIGDKREVDRTTLDFLGVDSHGGKDAVAMGLDGASSHHITSSTNSLYSGMKMEPAPGMQTNADGRQLPKF